MKQVDKDPIQTWPYTKPPVEPDQHKIEHENPTLPLEWEKDHIFSKGLYKSIS